jgi:hypothetical protein
MLSGVSPEERVWQMLVDEVGEALIEEAASVSVAQAEKELAAAGFDVAAERARAEAFLASLEGGAAASGSVQAVAQEAPPAPEKKGRSRVMWGAAAAAAVAAGAAAAVYVAQQGEQAKTTPVPPPSTSAPPGPPPEVVAATGLRRRAAIAYDEGHARECLELLDQARAKDPAGDAAPEVTRLREKAALERK